MKCISIFVIIASCRLSASSAQQLPGQCQARSQVEPSVLALSGRAWTWNEAIGKDRACRGKPVGH